MITLGKTERDVGGFTVSGEAMMSTLSLVNDNVRDEATEVFILPFYETILPIKPLTEMRVEVYLE